MFRGRELVNHAAALITTGSTFACLTRATTRGLQQIIIYVRKVDMCLDCKFTDAGSGESNGSVRTKSNIFKSTRREYVQFSRIRSAMKQLPSETRRLAGVSALK